jgi:ech hydrogenase subunit D
MMRIEEQPIRNVAPEGLLAAAEEMHMGGFRLVQICCTKLAEDSFELTYSFDKDYRFENLRVPASKETEMPSVSGVFKGSFLYENEIRELFGIGFRGISVDYNGHLYKKRVQTPFALDTKKGGDACQKGP